MIALDWEPEGDALPDGRQAWRAEHDDPTYEVTLRPEAGLFGGYYDLHLSQGTLELSIECEDVEEGKLFARAWLDAIAFWQTRVDALRAT
jgi:hypothetical protein